MIEHSKIDSTNISDIARQILVEALTKGTLTNTYTGEVQELTANTILSLAKYIYTNNITLSPNSKSTKPSNVPVELLDIFSE